MARITVEDCLDKVDNRFELVMVSSKRARQIQSEGKPPMVDTDDDKPTVIALREIAEGLVGPEILTAAAPVEIEGSDADVMLKAVEANEAALAAKSEAELTEMPGPDEVEDEDEEAE